MRVFLVCLFFCIVTATAISCNQGQTHQASGLVTTSASPSAIKASDYVTDNAKVIDDATRTQLETTLAAFKERTKIDFSVVTVKTTGDKSAFDYSLELARARKDSSFEQNVSGLLLLVAVDDRNWHVQITRNLETQLTKEILTDLSVPMTDAFKQKRYGEGIVKYVNAVIAKLKGT
jgi:uncharacterized membrane protein YgcG